MLSFETAAFPSHHSALHWKNLRIEWTQLTSTRMPSILDVPLLKSMTLMVVGVVFMHHAQPIWQKFSQFLHIFFLCASNETEVRPVCDLCFDQGGNRIIQFTQSYNTHNTATWNASKVNTKKRINGWRLSMLMNELLLSTYFVHAPEYSYWRIWNE